MLPGKQYQDVTVTVAPVDVADPTVLSPQTPYKVSLPVQLQTAAAGGPVDDLQLNSSLPDGGSYQVTALVRNALADEVTGNELAAAGTVYPEWAKRYILIEPGSIGPIVKQDADRIVADAARQPPRPVRRGARRCRTGSTAAATSSTTRTCAGSARPGRPCPTAS